MNCEITCTLIRKYFFSVVSSNAQICYRCFGSNWCNNFTDQNSVWNADIINCPATTKAYNYDGDNPLIARVLKNFEEASNTVNNTDPVTWGCVTATVHEGDIFNLFWFNSIYLCFSTWSSHNQNLHKQRSKNMPNCTKHDSKWGC